MMAILSVPSSLYAQQFYYGVQGGLNISDIALKSASGTKQLTSSGTNFGIGAVVGYKFNRNVALHAEPMYLRKGGIQKATSANPDITITISTIEIPVLVKAGFGEKIRPYFLAGPSVGFVLDAQAETEFGGVVAGQDVQTYTADLGGILEKVDVSFSVGAGLSYTMKNYQLFLNGRYTFGLTDLYKGGNIEWQSGNESFSVEGNPAAELKTGGIQIMIGIIF